MSKLIMTEKPLCILPTLAMQVGFKEALILQCLKECLENDPHSTSINEKIWVRKTYDDWQKDLPFWSVETIKRIISSLEEQRLILSSKIRESQFDHGKWYTINYPQLEEIKTEHFPAREDKYKKILINSDKHPLWIMACENLLSQTEELTLKKWLCEMDIIALTGSSVHLSVPNQIIKDWVISNFYGNLVESLKDALGYPIEKLQIGIQASHTFGDTITPKKEEEGTPPPTHPSSSTLSTSKSAHQVIGAAS